MTQQIVVVDYGAGNLRSAARALEQAAQDHGLSVRVSISNDPHDVRAADRIVLPGQGAFADCWHGLSMIPDMMDTLADIMCLEKKPFLGICVGMQLLADWGNEHGRHRGFSYIPGEVIPLDPLPGLKIPHMGWNDLVIDAPQHPVLAGISTGDHAYFVHSYHFVCQDPVHRLAHVDYGCAITAIVGRENIIATQFHPEKSQATGLKFLANFLDWEPET